MKSDIRPRAYNFYSIWIFVWVVLYKFNITKADPTFNVVLIIIWLILVGIISLIKTFIFNNVIKYSDVNKDILKSQLILFTIIDLLPIYLMYPYKLNWNMLGVNILVFFIYLTIMIIMKIPILDMYVNHGNLSHTATFEEYVKYRNYFYGVKS
jgi:hypothetical protein